jgi:hypothetical protein
VIEALKPRPQPKLPPFRLSVPEAAQGYRRQALADLHELTLSVSNLTDSHHTAPFSIACRIGKYCAHGVLNDDEIEGALMSASAANGALSKYAVKDLRAQSRNGLRRAAKDPLPPLARVDRGAVVR